MRLFLIEINVKSMATAANNDDADMDGADDVESLDELKPSIGVGNLTEKELDEKCKL